VCWGRHGRVMCRARGHGDDGHQRGTTTADGPRRRRCKRAALRATVLHTTAAAAGEDGSTGSPQRAVWCGRPWWLGMHDVFYSEAEEGSKRGRRSGCPVLSCPVLCSAAACNVALFTASSLQGSIHSLRRADDTGDQVGRLPDVRVAPAAISWHSQALAEHLGLGLVSHHDSGRPALSSTPAALPEPLHPPAPSPTRLFLAPVRPSAVLPPPC
jgi:hypothetical protein